MSFTEQEQQVRQFLNERFAGYDESVASSESLEGIVDSLGLFELVAFLEEKFSLAIPNSEFSPQLFENIEAIMEVIDEYRS